MTSTLHDLHENENPYDYAEQTLNLWQKDFCSQTLISQSVQVSTILKRRPVSKWAQLIVKPQQKALHVTDSVGLNLKTCLMFYVLNILKTRKHVSSISQSCTTLCWFIIEKCNEMVWGCNPTTWQTIHWLEIHLQGTVPRTHKNTRTHNHQGSQQNSYPVKPVSPWRHKPVACCGTCNGGTGHFSLNWDACINGTGVCGQSLIQGKKKTAADVTNRQERVQEFLKGCAELTKIKAPFWTVFYF